ncbi:MAG TPA: Gfo/Idh/MocA family oxidoreductase [Candidatus Binatia bacterium]|jgi:predicted dehydrogenase
MKTTNAASRLRLAVVGAGKHGSRYAAHAARDVDGIELVAVCRRDRDKGEALAREVGCEFESDAEKLISRRDVDAVVLATIPRLVPRFLALAIESGKRIILEKPVAPTLDKGLALLGLVERSGVYCLAAHTLRFNSTVEALRRDLPSIGRLDSLLFSQRFPPQLDLAWLDAPEDSGGGNILHTGVHCFDLLHWLSRHRVVEVSAAARRVRTRDTEDHFIALLAMDADGLLAQVACSRSTASRSGLIEASGEHGQLVVDHVLGTGYRLSPDGREELVIEPPRMTVRSLLERFVADARCDLAPPISYRDGLAAVAVAEACYRSVTSKAVERVRPLP